MAKATLTLLKLVIQDPRTGRLLDGSPGWQLIILGSWNKSHDNWHFEADATLEELLAGLNLLNTQHCLANVMEPASRRLREMFDSYQRSLTLQRAASES